MADHAQGHKHSVAESAADPKELVGGQQQHGGLPAPGAASRGQKVQGHLRRHRKWYLILAGTVVFLIIFNPIFFLVAVPAIVRNVVGSAELPVRAGVLEVVSPSHARFALTTELTTPGGLGAGLDAFTMELYDSEGKSADAFVTLDVPAQSLRGPTPVDVPSQVTRILDPAGLRGFLARAFEADLASVGVRTSTVARLGAGLAYPVAIDRVVKLEGLGGLSGLRVETIEPVSPPEADGTNIRGSLWVPNRSPLALGLGNVTYDVMANGVRVGTTTVEDLHIVPGNQTIKYKGQLDAGAIMANIEDVLGSLTEEGDLEFVVTGNRSTVDGEHIEFLDEVLSKIKIKTVFSICQAMDMLPEEVMMEMPLDLVMKLPTDKIMEC